MADSLLNERCRKALKIIAEPFRFKVCAGCESVVALPVTHCPNCHSYRFLLGDQVVIDQAKILAQRPQQSVTAADLTN